MTDSEIKAQFDRANARYRAMLDAQYPDPAYLAQEMAKARKQAATDVRVQAAAEAHRLEEEDEALQDLSDAIDCPEATPVTRCITGAEADIEANYPDGLAAYRRDEPVDRTPYHKPDCQ